VANSVRERFAAAVRRGTPQSVVPLIVRLRTRRALADPAMLADAREQMRFLLERTRPDADIEAHAREYVELWMRRAELRWRHKMVCSQPVDGLEHLLVARDLGRGVLVNFMHHAQYEGAFSSIAGLGVPSEVILHPNMLKPDAPEHMKQRVRVGTYLCQPHSTEIGMQGISDLVAAGKVVTIASDAPGSAEVTFAGRRLKGSSGAARIAVALGAPVVVLTTRRVDGEPRLQLSEPLLPADFDDAESLLAEMVRRHEEAILAWPAAADNPISRWAPVES
jgi:lauroyl/myristoyl acyltransferase